MADRFRELQEMANELIALEEKKLRASLTADERMRRSELTSTLFGLPMALAEQRHHFRVRDQRPAEVIEPVRDQAARITSVSGGGCFIETDALLVVGDEVKVATCFTQSRELGVEFRGEVRWRTTRQPGSRTVNGVGVAFTGIEEPLREALIALLRDHVSRKLELIVEKYRFMFECSPDMLLLLDNQNQVVDGNAAALPFLGGAHASGTRPIGELTTSESRQCLLDAIAAARNSARALRCEFTFPSVGAGKATPVDAFVVRVGAGDLDLGVLLIGRDLTPRLEVEQQQRDLERRLYQADKLTSLGRIAAGIAHDVNNPLAWVMANLSQLQERLDPVRAAVSFMLAAGDAPLSESDRESLVEIDRDLNSIVADACEGARRVRDVVRDLRTFSRVDVQEIVRVDVNDVLETTVRIVRNQIDQCAHVVRDFGRLPATHLNFGKCCQIFLNLVTNAVRAFADADVQRNFIELRTWCDGDVIRVSCKDNGRGIPAALRDKVFQPFFTTGAPEEGTGLGLTIALDAARAQGGDIELRSEVDLGTEFIVTLPVRPAPADGAEPTLAAAPRPTVSRHRLLIIDDEDTLLRSLARQLRANWDVVTADNGEHALARLADGPFDAVLCDVMLPETTGPALYHEIQKRHPALRGKVVFMTGGVFIERDRQALVETGAPIIEKPFSVREVERILHDLAKASADHEAGC